LISRLKFPAVFLPRPQITTPPPENKKGDTVFPMPPVKRFSVKEAI